MLNQSEKLNYKQNLVQFNKIEKLNPLEVLRIQLCIIEEGERLYDDYLQFYDFLFKGRKVSKVQKPGRR